MNKSLRDHYNKRYANDSKQHVNIIEPSKYPTNRATACVSVLPNLICGGKIIEFQESDYITFKNGKAENETRYREYLQWDGTGVLK